MAAPMIAEERSLMVACINRFDRDRRRFERVDMASQPFGLSGVCATNIRTIRRRTPCRHPGLYNVSGTASRSLERFRPAGFERIAAGDCFRRGDEEIALAQACPVN